MALRWPDLIVRFRFSPGKPAMGFLGGHRGSESVPDKDARL